MGRPANNGRLAACCGRHPLFFAALVAAICVLITPRSFPLALGLAALCGVAGGLLRNRLTGLAWLACGCLASGVYSVREAARTAAEQSLLASGGGEMHGELLKDAKGKGNFWSGPVRLLGGSQPGARVWWQGCGECPVAGAIVTARGNFSPLATPRNPGEFDQAAWLRGLGVAAIFQASWVPGTVTTGRWSALGAQIRKSFRTAVTTGLVENSQAAAVIRAVVIGELPPDAEDLIAAFRNSGTLHAFSVSGLHVAMVGTIAWCLLRLTGVPRRWAVLILLPLIFGYSWLTGNSPPAVRSAWMAVVFLGAFISRRRPDLLNALGAVLLVATLWDGHLLFQAGVQLSYGVVAAIALGARASLRGFTWLAKPVLYLPPALMNRRQKVSLWLRQHLAQSLGVSLAAAVGSTPLTAYHFGLVTPVSILAGVFFVPLIFVLLCVSMLAVVLYPLVPTATQWVNQANAKVADTCVLTAEAFAAVPGGHFLIRRENTPFLIIYQLDRGAGAACFSDGQGAAVLLDCGDPSSFKRRIAPSLQRLGIIPDSVILSHPDGSHLGGGAQVWQRFPIRQVVLPVEKSRSPALQAWAEQAPAAGLQTQLATNLQDLPMPAGARLEVIHAPSSQSLNAVADDRVAIYRLHWQGWKLLFTSDSGAATERALLLSQRDVSADVIIAGRHRTDANLSDPFLDAVNPQAIIASHSDFPPSEILNPTTLTYWRSRSIQVISQAHSGGVTLRIDPTGKLRLEGFADHSLILLSPR